MMELLKSKRLWVVAVMLAGHLLARYHVVLSSDAANAIADQLVLMFGAGGVIATRVMDSRKASPAAEQEEPAASAAK